MSDHLHYDIVVAGGGSSGAAAAISAARRGVKTLIVEEGNCLGGISTSGGVGEWFANVDGMGGILSDAGEILKGYGTLKDRFFNPEYLKIAWQILAERAGVDILFHSSVIEAKMAGSLIDEITIASCSKTLRAKAKFFIDATGEGDLGAASGAQFMKGDPETGKTLHMSLIFSLWDTGRLVKPWLPEGIRPIKSQDELPGLHAFIKLGNGRVYCNATKIINHDPTDPVSLSNAECESRRQLILVLHYLQTHGFETYELASSGSKIGIREGRRLIGDFILSEKHILGDSPTDFDDGIAVATSQIDFHSLSSQGHAGWRRKVNPYAIPFRCLVVKGVSNLLAAGKCVSIDQTVHSSIRMTPTCCAMGQSAGTAAAIATKDGLTEIRKTDIAKLRGELEKDGMELDPRNHKSFFIQENGSNSRDESA